jgi:hypothetical protein
MYRMSEIFHRNIVLMLVSIAVIPIMASLNAPSLSTNIGSIRPRQNFSRLGAVVGAEVDAAAEVALPVGAVAMVVIRPTPAKSGRAMMLRYLQHLPLIVALENITKNGAWFANLAGGIPLIQLDFTTNGSLILSPFPFLPLIFSGLNQGRILLREAVVGLRPPLPLLQQPRLVSHLVAH